jgi:hypothetical protein
MVDAETIRIMHQSDANDTRFQFEVIKSLADSVRDMGTTQTKMLERLARIEEHRIHEAVGKLQGRVDELEREKDRRDGQNKAWRGFLSWWGPLSWTIGILFTVFFLMFRATGVLVMPSDKKEPAPIVAPREQPKGDNP